LPNDLGVARLEVSSETRATRSPRAKAFWTKQFYLWHWVSSALALVGMLFFAVTGSTLNHAGQISAKPRITEKRLVLPPELISAIQAGPKKETRQVLPDAVSAWLDNQFSVTVGARLAQWSADEVHLDLPRPGGDAWLNLDRETGEATYEVTSRGFISYLNDLHKGRHTGFAWFLFLDVFSVACVVFCLTGLALLWVHSRRRPMTWPVVIAGLLLPVLVLIVFVHS